MILLSETVPRSKVMNDAKRSNIVELKTVIALNWTSALNDTSRTPQRKQTLQ